MGSVTDKQESTPLVNAPPKDLHPLFVKEFDDLQKHVICQHVCKAWRKLATENKQSYILQDKETNDCCRLFLGKNLSDELVVENFMIEPFSVTCKVLFCLDEFMLVKEKVENQVKLCVINQVTKGKLYLPKPHRVIHLLSASNEGETFLMLCDVSEGTSQHKVIHLWAPPGSKPRLELLNLGNGFGDDQTELSWKEKNVDDDLYGWEDYVCEPVTIKSRYAFWDVRSQNYLVRFDVKNEQLVKVHLPPPLIHASMEVIRYLFEDRGELLLVYCYLGWAHVHRLNRISANWEEVKAVEVSEDWRRRYAKQGLTNIPFPTSTIVLGRFLMFEKFERETYRYWWYYMDLKDAKVTRMRTLEYRDYFKWIPQISTSTGRAKAKYVHE